MSVYRGLEAAIGPAANVIDVTLDGQFPPMDSESLTDGSLILVEDSLDGFNKKYISKVDLAPPGPTIGQYSLKPDGSGISFPDAVRGAELGAEKEEATFARRHPFLVNAITVPYNNHGFLAEAPWMPQFDGVITEATMSLGRTTISGAFVGFRITEVTSGTDVVLADFPAVIIASGGVADQYGHVPVVNIPVFAGKSYLVRLLLSTGWLGFPEVKLGYRRYV